MVKIQGKPFIEYQLEFLKRARVSDVVLCLGHLGKQIEDYCGDGHKFGLNLKYSFEDRFLGTAGAVKQAEPLLEEVFFTLYGDSYVFLDFPEMMSRFKQENGLGMMSVYENHDRYDKSNTAVDSGEVKKYSKKDKTPDMVYIDYGANLFRREALQMVPASEPYSMEALFNQLIARKELMAYEVRDRFYEIGTPQGLAEFERFIKEQR